MNGRLVGGFDGLDFANKNIPLEGNWTNGISRLARYGDVLVCWTIDRSSRNPLLNSHYEIPAPFFCVRVLVRHFFFCAEDPAGAARTVIRCR